jgi:hypothetical protein
MGIRNPKKIRLLINGDKLSGKQVDIRITLSTYHKDVHTSSTTFVDNKNYYGLFFNWLKDSAFDVCCGR